MKNPVGPENDEYLRDICEDAEKVIAAWGTDVVLKGRGREVVAMLDTDLYALNMTKHGHPNHPLYQSGDIELEQFS